MNPKQLEKANMTVEDWMFIVNRLDIIDIKNINLVVFQRRS